METNGSVPGSVSSIDSRESLIDHLTEHDIDLIDVLKPQDLGRFNLGLDRYKNVVTVNVTANKATSLY